MIEPSVPGSPPPRDAAPRETDPVAPTVVPGEIVSEPAPDQARPFGRYRLVAELGRGAMGIVWKAWDTQLARVVALKMMRSEGNEDADQIERFQREARLAAKIVHPNVVRVLDVGEHEGQRYLTTEFVEAASLDTLMDGPVPPAQALAWVKAVAEALAAAHELGVIHRDIKPGNLLIDSQRKPYVMDFGLAKEVPLGGIGTTAEKLTLSGVLLGTPSYMSPEQAQGEVSTLGPATDQFSLGVVMYELLTGEMPFEGSGLHELLSAIVDQDPVPLRKLRRAIHPDLEAICLKALSKEPSRRYASMREMAADIQRHLDGGPTRARPMSFLGRVARQAAKRRAVLLPVVAVLFLAVVATIGVWRWRGEDVTRADEETERAKEAQARAEGTLEKARLVSRVLQRWNGIHEAITSMERAHFNSRLTPAARREAAASSWPAVETFIRETPGGPSSRAAMLALAGWARHLVEGGKEGTTWMRQATATDPDVPYGALLGALVSLLRYVEAESCMRVEPGETVALVGIDPSTPEELAALAEADHFLRPIREAAVWGEAGAEGFAALLEGIRAIRSGEFARAEAELTRALGSAQVRTFETVLRLVRAKSRFLQSKYEAAIEDLDAVNRAWPDHALPFLLRAVARTGLAATARPGDAEPILRQALDDVDAALERNMGETTVRMNRGALWIGLGGQESQRTGDGRASYRRAIEDYGWILERTPDASDARCNRCLARLQLAQSEAYQRVDPIPTFRLTLVDLDLVLARCPANAKVLRIRGQCHEGIGQAELEAGRDPSESVRLALADLDAALAAEPGHPGSLAHRGSTRLLQGVWDQVQGRDPTETYRLAIADLEEALGAEPGQRYVLFHRAVALYSAAVNDAGRGRDGRDGYKRAIREFDALTEQEDLAGEACYYRGMARRGLAIAETGMDPREALAKAIEDLERSVEVTPQNGRAWSGLVQARIALLEAQQARGVSPDAEASRALQDCGKALEIDPGNWRVLQQRGFLRVATGDAEGALRDFAETARLIGSTPGWLQELIDWAKSQAKPR